MSAHGALRLCLRGPLVTYAQSLSPVPGIAWEGRSFSPTPGAMYFRETLLPGSSRRSGPGPLAFVRHEGIYQIDVMIPAGNEANGDSIADAIIALYWPGRPDLTLSTGHHVRLRAAERARLQVGSSWHSLPISIQYQYDTLNPQ